MNKIQADTKSFIETQCRIAGCTREAKALSKGYSVIVEGCFDNSGADDDIADEISDFGNGNLLDNLRMAGGRNNGGDETCYVSAKIVNPMMIDDIDRMIGEGNLKGAIEKYKGLVSLPDGGCYTNFVPNFTDDSGNDSGFVLGTHDGVTLAHNDTELGTADGMYLIYRELSPEENKFAEEHFEDNTIEF